MKLGFSPNDQDPKHIKAAYEALMALRPNIKLFASEGVQATVIDEDAHIGVIWNGDAYKAQLENPNIRFVFPEEGYIIWVDCLAIPKNAPHLKAAYQFINFLLRQDIGKQIALKEGFGITNQAAFDSLPAYMHNNTTIYPTKKQLKHAIYQSNMGEATMNLYNQYWQQFKLSV
jgi:spermidine/putrescine transport system substrate-binding protein